VGIAGVTTGYGSQCAPSDRRPGEDVAIVGSAGSVWPALQGPPNAGARYIFAIDPVNGKRDQALKVRRHPRLPRHQRRAGRMPDVTHGLMAHKVVVTVGELHGADIDSYLGHHRQGRHLRANPPLAA